MSPGIIVFLAVAALLVLWGIGAHNRLVGLRGAVARAWVPLDAQIGRRHALALDIGAQLAAPPAQVALGDDIAQTALSALQAAARQAVAAAAHARVRASSAGAIQSLSLAEQVLTAALRPVPVLVEARAAALDGAGLLAPVQDLLHTLQEVHVQTRLVRVAFNDAVGAYNAAIEEMPTRLLAGPLGFRPAAALAAEPPEPPPPDATGVAAA